MAPTKQQGRGSKRRAPRAWWRQPGNRNLIIIGVTGLLIIGVMMWRQRPPVADVDEVVVASTEFNDPRMLQIEARFECPCGNCNHLELAECSCDVPGGALEMKTAIARLLAGGQTETAVVASIASRFGGLKPEAIGGESPLDGDPVRPDELVAANGVDLYSSHKSQAAPDTVTRVASVFDCPCGNCVKNLADCICDHANGAVEVKAFIGDRLTEGLDEADVVESVMRTFQARRTRLAASPTSLLSTIH